MKKIFFWAVLLALILASFIWYRNNFSSKYLSELESGAFRPDASSATFSFENGPITLSQGRYESRIEGSSLVDEVSLTDTVAYGDLNGDQKEDSAVILTETSGGSGVFIYLAGFVSGPVSYSGTNVILLGDRVAPQSLSIDRGIITARYLDRRESEAMASEPTVPITKQFVLRNGELVEQ